MKSFLFILFVSFITFNSFADRESHLRAKRYGAIATFKLSVVDDQGAPLKGVNGSASFWCGSDNYDKDTETSDENGVLILSGKCKYNGGFALQKEGYYETMRSHKFSRASDDDVEETLFTRKWVPDYVNTEVLKKIRNPIPMYARQWRTAVPACEQPIGLDLKVADWVKPHGKGEIADVYITIHLGERTVLGRIQNSAMRVTFDFPNKHNGVQVCNIDKGSEFRSSYHVDLSRPFQQQLILGRGETREDWLPLNKYLVFRIRSESSADGELLQCYYGKIYPAIDVTKKEIAFRAIYFNPTPNDTNLEFNPEHNLSSKETLEDERRGYVPWP